jgi:hypothetical protein
MRGAFYITYLFLLLIVNKTYSQEINNLKTSTTCTFSAFYKPIFHDIKSNVRGAVSFGFCTGDTLKLDAGSNFYKGDTLKWYFNDKLYTTGAPITGTGYGVNFTESGKLYAIKIDSFGCKVSSDTVTLEKIPISPAPILKRDSANFLVSNYPKNTWALDGNILALNQWNYPFVSGNNNRQKPTQSGNYTVTPYQSCASLSSSYYFLLTDIINLNEDEFIKIAPNPFASQLNFDYVVKGYPSLNIEVFDIATGTKVASKQNLTTGMPIYLGQLSAGTYVFKVSSKDNKISYQFKMVKL